MRNLLLQKITQSYCSWHSAKPSRSIAKRVSTLLKKVADEVPSNGTATALETLAVDKKAFIEEVADAFMKDIDSCQCVGDTFHVREAQVSSWRPVLTHYLTLSGVCVCVCV